MKISKEAYEKIEKNRRKESYLNLEIQIDFANYLGGKKSSGVGSEHHNRGLYTIGRAFFDRIQGPGLYQPDYIVYNKDRDTYLSPDAPIRN